MINFVEINPDKIIGDMIDNVEIELGETLHSGDEKRLFLQGLAPIVVAIANNINDTGNQNLLRYARDEKLEALAEDFYKTERQKATNAFCNGKVKLSIAQNEDYKISSGIKVTSDGNLMFKIRDDVIVKKGELEADLVLEALEVGSKYNGYDIGKINSIVDPTPYVEAIYNTEISASGSDIEEDDSYRERSRLSMESLSTAGPNGAYEYFALSADNSITNVKVISPSPGVVRILVLVDGGEIPSQEILDKVYNECSQKDRRPLTDKVETAAPDVVNYNIELTYYLDKNFTIEEGSWRKEIEGANLDFKDGAIREFIEWQQGEIGKSINPDELRYKIQDAAGYEANSRRISGVRRIVVTSPVHTEIGENEIAKVQNINVTYGGLE